MDQMACGVGGSIILDFSDGVAYRKVDFGFDRWGMIS
jgi:galactokinase